MLAFFFVGSLRIPILKKKTVNIVLKLASFVVY